MKRKSDTYILPSNHLDMLVRCIVQAAIVLWHAIKSSHSGIDSQEPLFGTSIYVLESARIESPWPRRLGIVAETSFVHCFLK